MLAWARTGLHLRMGSCAVERNGRGYSGKRCSREVVPEVADPLLKQQVEGEKERQERGERRTVP